MNYKLEDESLVQIINERNTTRLVNLIDPTKVAYGGTYDVKSRFIEPTLMTGVDWSDKVMQEEIFGPILPIMTYSGIEDVVATIKDKAKPLALYLFTQDAALKAKVLSEVSFGGGCVNETIMHIANGALPFGGVGDSGTGNYHGQAGFRAFSHFKSILDRELVADPAIKYSPHTAEKLAMLRSVTGQ